MIISNEIPMECQFYYGRISNVRVFTNYSVSEFYLFYVSICHNPSVFLDECEKKKRKKKIEKRRKNMEKIERQKRKKQQHKKKKKNTEILEERKTLSPVLFIIGNRIA